MRLNPRRHHRTSQSRKRRGRTGLSAWLPILLACGLAGAAWLIDDRSSGEHSDSVGLVGSDRTANASPSAYYRNCDSARAAGAAPIRTGEPGYRSALDADSDGVACEPYYGN